MIGQSGVIKLILCGLLLFGIGIIVLNFMSSKRHQHSHRTLARKPDAYDLSQMISTKFSDIKADYKSHDKPIANKNKIDLSKISIEKYKISLDSQKVCLNIR